MKLLIKETEPLATDQLIATWAAAIQRFDRNYRTIQSLVEVRQLAATYSFGNVSLLNRDELYGLLETMRQLLCRLESELGNSTNEEGSQFSQMLKYHITALSRLNTKVEAALSQVKLSPA